MKDIPQSLIEAIETIDNLNLTDNLKARILLRSKMNEWELALDEIADKARDHMTKAGE